MLIALFFMAVTSSSAATNRDMELFPLNMGLYSHTNLKRLTTHECSSSIFGLMGSNDHDRNFDVSVRPPSQLKSLHSQSCPAPSTKSAMLESCFSEEMMDQLLLNMQKATLPTLENLEPTHALWNDELRSGLAQPLDAMAFCTPATDSQQQPWRTTSLSLMAANQIANARPEDNDNGETLKYGTVEDGSNVVNEDRVWFQYSEDCHEAATFLQCAWKNFRHRRIDHALTMQRVLRGQSSRKHTQGLWRIKTDAVLVLQAYFFRVCLAKKEAERRKLRLQMFSAQELQRVQRGRIGRVLAERRYHFVRTRAAVMLQSWSRLLQAKTILHKLSSTNLRIHSCVARIQAAQRAKVARDIFRRRLFNYVVKMQQIFRARLQRIRYARLKNDSFVTRIQRIQRGLMGRRRAFFLYANTMTKELQRLERERELMRIAGIKNAEMAKKDVAEGAPMTPALKKKLQEICFGIHQERKKRKLEYKRMTPKEKERAQCRDIFDNFDLDGSGEIELDELKALVKELCLPLKDKEIEEAFAFMDLDGSKTVDFLEFFGWWTMEKGGQMTVLLDEVGHESASSNQSPSTVEANMKMLRLKLKGRKMWRDLTGSTVWAKAKKRYVLDIQNEGRLRGRDEFRRDRSKAENSPMFECPTCQKTFALSCHLEWHLTFKAEKESIVGKDSKEKDKKTNDKDLKKGKGSAAPCSNDPTLAALKRKRDAERLALSRRLGGTSSKQIGCEGDKTSLRHYGFEVALSTQKTYASSAAALQTVENTAVHITDDDDLKEVEGVPLQEFVSQESPLDWPPLRSLLFDNSCLRKNIFK